MKTPQTADVIVIGAGVVGLCTALQLVKRAPLRVIVLEKEEYLGGGSTGASSAVCRHLYSHGQMVELARDGIDAYRNWPPFLESQNCRAEFQQHGVLWLGGESKNWGENDKCRLESFGIPVDLLDDADLADRFPAINPCVLAPDFETGEAHECKGGGTHLYEVSGGFMDPQNVLEDLVEALSSRLVEILFGRQVTRIVSNTSRATGVLCANGDHYQGEHIVNASGPWCNELLEGLGMLGKWPLKPTRIQILHLDRPVEVKGELPVCVDMESGIYFRTQNRGQQLIVGSTLEADERERIKTPDEFNRLADDDFASLKLHALHHRLPDLPYRGKVGGYSGLYTVNEADMHPVVGRTPIEGFFVANGFSGHGFKLAPAIGSLIAQDLTGMQIESDTTVPIEFVGWDRAPIFLESKTVLA